jgi:recombination protein RecA
MWIDLEACFTESYAKSCGVDIDKLIVIRPDNMNEALEAIRVGSSSGLISFIAIDSVAAMVPKDEFDKDVGGGMIGTRARLMSSTLPQIVKHCSDTGCIAFFINQERACNITGMGPKSTTAGGSALPYYSSVRLDMNRVGWLEGKSGEKIGFQVSVASIKNKTYIPFKKALLTIMYPSDTTEGGIDLIADVVTNSIEMGVVKRSGSWLYYNGESIQGEPKFKQMLRESPELLVEIRHKVMEIINNGGHDDEEGIFLNEEELLSQKQEGI